MRFKFKNFFVGILFSGVAVLFLVLIARDEAVTNYAAFALGHETPCTITGATVREKNDNGLNRVVTVRFHYEVSGKTTEGEWTGPSVKRRAPTQAELDEILSAHRPGSTSTCRLHSDTPGSAILHADFPWGDFGCAMFVLIFLFVGLSLTLSTLGLVRGPDTWFAGKRTGKGIGLFAGLLFAGVGYGMLFGLWKKALTRTDISAWVETPCVIEAASVRKLPGNKGRISRQLEVRYAYQVNGREFRGENIRPGISGESISRDKDSLVARYAPGTATSCKINPLDSTQATLEGHADETTMRFVLTLFFSVFAILGTALTAAFLFGDKVKASPRLQKAGIILFVTLIVSAFCAAAMTAPSIRIQGFTTNSWYARGGMIAFALCVGATVLYRTVRQIDEKSVEKEPAGQSLGVTLKRPRTKKRRR